MMRSQIMIPHVIEQEAHGERQYDIFSRLVKDRIIIISTPIDDTVASVLVAELLYLQSVDPQKELSLYINCPGGGVTAGLAVYDTMQMLSCDICTYCLGQASSFGAVLLAAGTKGKRYALPNARIMLHQPWGGTQGTAADIRIQAKEILHMRDSLNNIIAHHTGQDIERVCKDTERDFFMSPEDAKEYGLVDVVLTPASREDNGQNA